MAAKGCAEIDEWIDLAIAQGWGVRHTAGGHVLWQPPTGETFSTNGPQSSSGYRTIRNVRAKLKRAGLLFTNDKEREPVPKYEVIDPEQAPKLRLVPLTLDILSDKYDELKNSSQLLEEAQAALIAMVEEQADQYARFVKATQESLMELRRQVRAATQDKPTPVDTSQFVTITKADEMLDELSKYVDTKLEEVARKADPIAAFKARLGGSA